MTRFRRVITSLALTLSLAFLARPEMTDASFFPYGQCTWYAAVLRPDVGSRVSGNAWQWLGSAQRSGLATGVQPRVSAVAVFQPWVQGAGWFGHVAIVREVRADGSFRVSEENFPFLGWETYRVAHVGPGVSFIY